ncbi:VP1 [Cat Tien Hospitalitermes polycipi-like virus]|nr:VP1 [Cat Tien Hospitalitermes polycipi-like virus]
MTTNDILRSVAKEIQVQETFPLYPTNVQHFSTNAPTPTIQTLGQLVGMKRFQNNFDLSVQTFTYFDAITDADWSRFSSSLINVYLSKRWRMKYTFIIVSNQQHIGCLYFYWFPGSVFHKMLAYYFRAGATSADLVTDLPGTTITDLKTAVLPPRLACQLDTFKLIRLGKSTSWTFTTEWNSPFANHINLYKNADWPNATSIPLGELGLAHLTQYRVASGVSDKPTLSVWQEIEFENLSVPIVLPSNIPV